MNRKFKSTITRALILLLLMSSIPSFAASTRFKDVPKDHWAHSYVEDMAKLGYLGGYPDGSFLPSGRLTFVESMSALSRFMNPSEKEKAEAIEEHSFFLNELNIRPDWEREALSIALYKGIVSENEVRNAHAGGLLTKPIQRETISVFLAKAMGLEQLVREKTVIYLPYTDFELIGERKSNSDKDDREKNRIRRHINVLLDIGVLSKDGTGNGEFEPKSTLTRAEMATLLSNGYDYLKDNPIEDEPEEKTETIKAYIKRITDNHGMKVLVIDNIYGEEEGYTNNSDTSVTIDGKEASFSSLVEGQEVELEIIEGTMDLLSVKAISMEEEVEGVIDYINSSRMELTLKYKDGSKSKTQDYKIDDQVKVYLDEKSAKVEDLDKGNLLEVKARNNIISEIHARSHYKKLNGVITDISPIGDSKDSYYIITLEDKDENLHEFYTDSDTRVYRKRRVAEDKDLRVTDYAYIEGEYDIEKELYLASEVDADVQIRKIKGNITQITNIYNKNPLITINDWESEKEETYEITRDADIYVDSKSVSSLPSTPGYFVEVVLESDEIVEIYIDSTGLEESVMGKVMYIDHKRGIIELEDYKVQGSQREINIYFSKDVVVLDQKPTKLKAQDIRRGDKVNIIGTREGANFVAKIINIL